jgi:hypothetical protein
MLPMKKFLLLLLLCGAFLLPMQASPGADVPAFHDAPPPSGTVLPPVLTEKQLAAQGVTSPTQIAAYKAAAKVPNVLYQMPCYCYCDRAHGHTSLHTCFESTHGSFCGTCMSEALYAYRMTKKGWSPTKIRAAIINGDWKSIDLGHPPAIS